MNYFFQNPGDKNTRMVNNSRRPSSIKNDKTHFPTLGIAAKLSTGPTSPIAGPIFPNDEIVAPIAVLKSSPMIVIIKEPAPKIMK